MKKRSDLAIILENLERLFLQANMRWCWMTHGPVPESTGHNCRLSDQNVYDVRVLAWMLPQLELQYMEHPMKGIQQEYSKYEQIYFNSIGGK